MGPEVKTVWVIGIGAVKKSAVEEEDKRREKGENQKGKQSKLGYGFRNDRDRGCRLRFLRR